MKREEKRKKKTRGKKKKAVKSDVDCDGDVKIGQRP